MARTIISLVIFVIAFCWCFRSRHGSLAVATDSDSDSDGDTLYRVCIEKCGDDGCVGHTCFKQCNYSSMEAPSWSRQQPAYADWNRWVCESECRYHCTVSVEDRRQKLGFKPQKYHRKWPANPFNGIQEPVPTALSGVALAMHFHGWVSFMIHVNYKLPLRPDKKTTYYEYTGLWHVYALLAMNAWLWSGAFHSRDVEFTEKLDCLSGVVLLSYTVFLAILRSFSVKDKASRLTVAVPIFAVAVIHILYMSFYEFDHRLNTLVCMLLDATHVTLWAGWVAISRHPSRWKMWSVVLGGGVPTTVLTMYDFPPYWGFLNAHSIWHATMIPLVYIWWDFIRDDSEFRTLVLINKEK